MLNRLKLICAVALVLFPVAAKSQEGGDVQILQSQSISMMRYGMSWQNVSIRFLLEQSADFDLVLVNFLADDGQTTTVPATRLSSTNKGQEVWQLHANLNAGDYEFTVSGVNQDGTIQELANRPTHIIREDTGPVLYDNHVIMNFFDGNEFWNQRLNFAATVKNLSYDKIVTVHYSYDNWRTEQRVLLQFTPSFLYGYGRVESPNQQGFEIWIGALDVPADVKEVVYYFSYEVNGVVYNDRNFGAYYRARPAQAL